MQTYPPPPPPFLDHRDAYTSMGFHHNHIETTTSDHEDECLLRFCLYAQARSKDKQWSIHTVNNDVAAGRFNVTHLEVNFDTECDHEMCIVFVTPSHGQGSSHGFYWLHINTISAFCSTMPEALDAINAIAQYVPVLMRRRTDAMNRMRFQYHLCRSIEIMANNLPDKDLQDHVHIAAMRRKLSW
jgi:hypothetical protein